MRLRSYSTLCLCGWWKGGKGEWSAVEDLTPMFINMLFATSKASGRPGILNGLVASLHLGLNPRLNYFVIDCCYRLVKTVQSVASVEGKCLLISVPFVNISPVWTRIRTIVKNVEYAGRSRETFLQQN